MLKMSFDLKPIYLELISNSTKYLKYLNLSVPLEKNLI